MNNALESFLTILSIRPTWMWEVRKMQELFSADPHGCGKCGKCRSYFLPTHMDVGSRKMHRYMDVTY